MIQVIMGNKGSGKTVKLINYANEALKTERGHVFFLDNSNRHMYDLQREIRFVDASEYKISSPEMFYGMICGMLSANFDITLIVVDGLLRMIDVAPSELEELFSRIDVLSKAHNVNFVIGVSGDPVAMPEFITRYAI